MGNPDESRQKPPKTMRIEASIRERTKRYARPQALHANSLIDQTIPRNTRSTSALPLMRFGVSENGKNTDGDVAHDALKVPQSRLSKATRNLSAAARTSDVLWDGMGAGEGDSNVAHPEQSNSMAVRTIFMSMASESNWPAPNAAREPPAKAPRFCWSSPRSGRAPRAC